MSEIIQISRLVNLVQFKVDNSYKKTQDKIKRMAGLWSKSSNQMSKSFEQGRRVVNQNIKSNDKLSRMEIRQQRTRKQTLRADNIRFKDTLNNNEQFKAQLQKINADFLKGNISFKERSAHLGQLNKQYKQLNQSAQRHNKISRIVGSVGAGVRGMAGSAATSAAIGVGTLGAAGYAAQRGFDSVKAGGQQYEALTIGLKNTFGDRSGEISNVIANMANLNGAPLIELGNNLVEFVALMKPLGVTVDDAITRFQQTQNAMQSYGIGGERAAGFQQQLTQALDQGTLDSFKEAFAWAPQLRADLLQYVQKSMGASQQDFLGGLTNGKFSLKDTWFKFLSANANKYSKMSNLYKQSSMATDSRASNQLSIAIYRIFESSGFKEAMEYSTKLLNRWGVFLESNAKQIGQIFGNLYKITGELADQGLKELTNWLKELTADDIRQYFNDFKNGLSDLAFIIKTIAQKMRQMFPDIASGPDEKGRFYVQREKHYLNQGYSGQEAGRLAEGEMRKKFDLGFTVPTFENNMVRQTARNTAFPASSNFSGELNLKINTEVNQPKLDQYVWASIDDNNNRMINVWSSN